MWATLGLGLKGNLEGRRVDAVPRIPNENPPSSAYQPCFYPARPEELQFHPPDLSPQASQAADVLKGRPRCPPWSRRRCGRTVPRLVLATEQSSDLWEDVERKLLIIPSGCCRSLGSSIFYLTRTKSQSKTNAPFTKQKRKAVDDKKKQEKNMLWTIFLLLSSYFVFQMKHPYMQIHFCIFWLIAGKIDINISGNGHDINISLARLQLCVCVYVVWKDVYGEFSQQTLLISLWSRVFKNLGTTGLERIDRKGSGSLRNIPNFKH